ncbi:hypothetical protein MRX96_034877 [Rhipicephalus microplus]
MEGVEPAGRRLHESESCGRRRCRDTEGLTVYRDSAEVSHASGRSGDQDTDAHHRKKSEHKKRDTRPKMTRTPMRVIAQDDQDTDARHRKKSEHKKRDTRPKMTKTPMRVIVKEQTQEAGHQAQDDQDTDARHRKKSEHKKRDTRPKMTKTPIASS